MTELKRFFRDSLHSYKQYLPLFLSCCLLIFSIIIAYITIFYKNSDNIKVVQNNYWDEKYWEKIIDRSGPIAGYEQLKNQLAGWAYLPTHQALHAFGFGLYNKYGQRGVQYCDDFQRFGCFHGVLAAYISDKGISSLSNIESICPRNQPDSENKCLHGVGHGLVDYLGRYRLNEALKYCEKIGSLTYLGCPQGAIMEYFAPINNQETPVFFDESKLFGPCPSLAPEFQKFCYFFVPGFYWPQEIISDSIKAESYCRRINEPDLQQLCIISIGVHLSSKSNFDLLGSANVCLKMKETKNQIFCTAGVRWNSGGKKENIAIAQNLCNRFGKVAEKVCQVIAVTLNN